MKFAVEFPSISYREGPGAVIKLARELERIGFDQIDMFDHVVMGYPTESRPAPMYPPEMPILEALMTLSFIAAATNTIGLGTEVLVLPQRQAALVAKQISTLDTLSNGRVRLGVGVGWQAAEYEALDESFAGRGKRMDDSIRLLRACWSDKKINFSSQFHHLQEIAMEPKPPQGGKLPIWVGGHAPLALKRVGVLADGWLATSRLSDKQAIASKESIFRHAEEAGRDPATIGMQMMLDSPPRDAAGKTFYQDMDKVRLAAARIDSLGFGWATVNATAIFQSGARSVDTMIEVLEGLHETLRAEFG